MIAEQRLKQVLIQFDNGKRSQIISYSLKEIADTRAIHAFIQHLQRLMKVVGRTIGVARIGDNITLMEDTVENKTLACKNFSAMKKFDGFLTLDPGDHRGCRG